MVLHACACKALSICEVACTVDRYHHGGFLIPYLVETFVSHLVRSLPFPRQPWELFAVARGGTLEVTPGRYKNFVSVTLPNLIGISIALQLQAVLLAHVSDLT